MPRNAAPSSSSVRRPYWPHLRQLSRTSLDKVSVESPRSPDTVSSNSTLRAESRDEAHGHTRRKCTVTINESFARDEVLLNLDLFNSSFRPGMLVSIDVLKPEVSKQQSMAAKRLAAQDTARSGASEPAQQSMRYIFVVKDMARELKVRYPHVELYVAKQIADVFGLKKGSQVILAPVDENNAAIEASHVELTFKDQYLSRADMWRIAVGELADRTVYKGQMMLFMGTVKAQISAVFVQGNKVNSAFFGTNTKPIFRSESARYVLFIQMAKEMWDFDSDDSGEIMFNKVVNGFLPALFKKWADLRVKHLVTIVLFARVEYDTGITTEFGHAAFQNDYCTGVQTSGNKRPYKDFYRVVVSEMGSGEWTTILYELKKEFNYFRRDISTDHLKAMESREGLGLFEEPGSKSASSGRIKAESSRALYGNVLEAIHMASSLYAHDYIDRDLMRTGISVVVISPGPGVFEVDYETLRKTTEALVGNGIGIDLICVPKIPLHSVPLFRYRNPKVVGPLGRSKAGFSYGSTPKLSTPLGASWQSMAGSFSPNRNSDISRRFESLAMRQNDEWCFALPQWLHVSYWTGNTANALSFEGIALSVADQSKQAQDNFAIRCRMYDLQMRSVLETNEIESMPLLSDPFFQQSVLQNPTVQKSRIHDLREVALIPAQRVHDPLRDNVHGLPTFGTERLAKHGEKSLLKQLQEFDDARAQLTSARRPRRMPRPIKDLEEGTKTQLNEDRSLLDTTVSDRRASISSQAQPIAARLARKKVLDGSDTYSHSRNSSDGTAESSRPSPLKAPKFLRQISLGHRGFGIAAPQAAVAQVHVEHANAIKENAPSVPQVNVPNMNILKSRPVTPQSVYSGSSTSAKDIVRGSAFGSRDLRAETPSRPMHIRSAQGSEDTISRTVDDSFSSTLKPSNFLRDNPEQRLSNMLRRADVNENDDAHRNKLLAGAVPELPAMLSPETAMAPWLTVINPSNPDTDKVDMARLYSRWQHVFVRPSAMRVMKWKSLCSPAAVPLTTEYFPTKEQFDREYQRQPYKIDQDEDDDMTEQPRSREDFLRELISLRFSQGFQVVIGPAVARAFGQKHVKVGDIFSRDREVEDGTSVFMAVGNTIHQLSCVNETEVEVTIYVRKPTEPTKQPDTSSLVYKPAIRTILDSGYETIVMNIIAPRTERNWNFIDSFIAGHYDEMTENMGFWRARYVLIPTTSLRNLSNPDPKFADNEEEIRLEGIKYLAQQWLKHRYVPPNERRFQPQGPQGQKRKSKDPNPLDIVYKTEDPSLVIAAELETLPLLETLEPGTRRGQLVTNRDRFKKSNFSVAALAEAMQQPVEEGGVRLQNRRWHLRLHYNCFIGSDMTSWLLDNFEDLESREEAEALGNSLMVDKTREIGGDQDLFVHVEKRHQFRDGQYFYQISPDYTKPHTPGWFNSARRNLVSVPATPMAELAPRESPRIPLSRPGSMSGDDISGATTPAAPVVSGRRPRVALSKVMKYDVDPRKRSYRPERIDLHYDRLHNPDNCYHIRIEWLNTTPKLIEDAVESWTRDLTRFGLRLVEVPIGEVRSINEVNPFRKPYLIKLALQPPDQQPYTYYDVASFGSSNQSRRQFYHKAILRKFDFVLDMEAASDFPSNVEVTYSWGKPDFKFPQYIHRSGTAIVQITDDGDFLILGNRLYTNRVGMHARDIYMRELRNEQQAAKDRRGPIGGGFTPHGLNATPTSSPMLRPAMFASPMLRPAGVPITTSDSGPNIGAPSTRTTGAVLGSVGNEPWHVKDLLEAFCADPVALEGFYKETLESHGHGASTGSSRLRPTTLTPGMGPSAAHVADGNIPVIGLPPAVLGKTEGEGSPVSRIGSPGIAMTAARLLRRGSVQPNH
ncbi:unnamed protein product [Discula destructiva]